MPIYDAIGRNRDSEIIIAEDGSTDGTKAAAKELAKKHRHVKVISRPKRSGKGKAIKDAVAIAKGSVIGYMDIDVAVPLEYINKAVQKVEMGNKIVIGSRYKAGAAVHRSIYRLLESVAYNFLIRLFLGSKVRDHQCGFKFFSATYLKKAVKDVEDDHFLFDAELLVRAQREGLVPYEMPVEWHEGTNTKVKAGDTLYFLTSIFKLRKELKD